jgi:predicted flap endonuclease-1-like 5' DNA nuclease
MFQKYRTLIGLLVASVLPTACSNPVQEARRAKGIPWWVWLLVIVVAFLVFIWLWLSEPKRKAAPPAEFEAAPPPAKPETAIPTTESETVAPSQVVETPQGVARRTAPIVGEVEALEPDDLKLIEGIGPKISSLLQSAGIMTFAHLASTDVKRLKQIIAEARLTALADPTSWPEQATLAATGRWDELETLQDELKGGRWV